MTWITTQSPQLAKIVGPGIVPFTAITGRLNPSGAASSSLRLSQYSRVTPVFGTIWV